MAVAFALSDELTRYGRLLREWGVAEVRPRARIADLTQALPPDSEAVFDACPVPIVRLRDPNRQTPPEFPDGNDARRLVYHEAIAYGDLWAHAALGDGLGPLVIRMLGAPEQVKQWLPEGAGEPVIGFALTEPDAGSDTSRIKSRAVRDGDSWVVTGTKMYCSRGAEADFVVVFALLDGLGGNKGTRGFLVQRGTPGFEVLRAHEDKLGLRSWVTSQLVFDECRIPLENLLGYTGDSEGGNTGSAMTGLAALDRNRANVSAQALGVASAALDVTTLLLAEQRASFSIARQRAIDEDLERMDYALTRVRRMNYRAQWRSSVAQSNRLEVASAKAYGPPIAERVLLRCMQLLGPDGFSTDLLLEKWYRDVRIMDIFEGTGQIHRRTISKMLMGSAAAQ
jgi:acyl-CoA dehydrogenase